MAHQYAAQAKRQEMFERVRDVVDRQAGSDDLIRETIGYLCGVSSAATPDMFSFVEDKQSVFNPAQREQIRKIADVLQDDWRLNLNPRHLDALLARLIEADREEEQRRPVPAGISR